MEGDHAGTRLTQLLHKAGAGDVDAQTQLCDLVYEELREAAHGLLRRKHHGSMQTTELVHELFEKLLAEGALATMENRKYFFAAAVDQMGKILVDHHRRRQAQKRGGHYQRVPLDVALDAVLDDFKAKNRCDIEALDEALEGLKKYSFRQYEVVRHRFYGGLTNAQTAEVLGVAVGTVERDWRLARAKLHAQLRDED